jgi:hypothetical protein
LAGDGASLSNKTTQVEVVFFKLTLISLMKNSLLKLTINMLKSECF